MPQSSDIFPLNRQLDDAGLHEIFKRDRKLQISNFLAQDAASEIEKTLSTLEWRLVLNENGKHYDIHPLQIEALGAEKTNLVIEAAKQRKATQFQYLYENYPITDMARSGNLKHEVLLRLLKTMNHKSILSFLNKITGSSAQFCDMQATCYRAGHFLTRHDDGNIGKNRQFAYVYSLCQDWQADWGGQLQFFDAQDNINTSFVPGYNTLSIFRVPAPHHVNTVAEFASNPRYSITGWFRTK